jgi:hypothetical protein
VLTFEELHDKLDCISVNISMMRRSDGAIRCVTQAGELEDLEPEECGVIPVIFGEYAVARGCIADMGFGAEHSGPISCRVEFDGSDPRESGVRLSVQLVFDGDEPSPCEFARGLSMVDWGR